MINRPKMYRLFTIVPKEANKMYSCKSVWIKECTIGINIYTAYIKHFDVVLKSNIAALHQGTWSCDSMAFS